MIKTGRGYSLQRLDAAREPLVKKEWANRSAVDSDFGRLITGPTAVHDQATGELVMVQASLYALGLDSGELAGVLQHLRYDTNYRTNGLKTTSRILGYEPRKTLRKDFCSPTSLLREEPTAHQVILRYAAEAARLYERAHPELYASHQAQVSTKVRPEYKLKGTPFTSGIINKNNPLKYHYDRGNFPDVWSVMLVLRHEVEGGYLSVPEFRLGFALPNNSLFLFDGQKILHGVTPIRRRNRNAYRYSLVFYSLRQMWACEPLEDELARIRKVKTQRERKRVTGGPSA